MKAIITIILAAALLSSCGDTTYTCACIDKGNSDAAIASYEISTDKESSASFECKQKGLKFEGQPQYSNVSCELTQQ